MRKQVSECDDSAAVKQDLASPVFIVQLAEKFAAASARRPRRAVRKYGDEADDPVFSCRHHRGGRRMFSAESHRARRVDADPGVDVPAVGQQGCRNFSG